LLYYRANSDFFRVHHVSRKGHPFDGKREILEKDTMNHSLKGAFWSGLVFPGLGQVVLKHYKRGAVIILAVLTGLSVIVVQAVQKAFIILEKIASEGGAMDMNAIFDAASQASTHSDSLIFSFAVLLITLCWIIGVVDAYRIGKKKDKEEDLMNS